MRLRHGGGGASGVERWTRYVRLLEYTRWGVEKLGRFDMTEDLGAETYDQIDLKEVNIMPDGERGEVRPSPACVRPWAHFCPSYQGALI